MKKILMLLLLLVGVVFLVGCPVEIEDEDVDEVEEVEEVEEEEEVMEEVDLSCADNTGCEVGKCIDGICKTVTELYVPDCGCRVVDLTVSTSDGEEKKKWIVFGRSQYNEGYEEGWSDPRCD